jgi:ferredoxin--NADP+ reductase
MTQELPSTAHPHTVAVIGAGPAGLYATKKLVQAGVNVVLINRDIKPGGLAEYGIYPSKHKMKEGLRKQFRKILALPEVTYLGGAKLGNGDDASFSLADLGALPFSAVLFTIGAQGTRKLGLPGEDQASCVFHAKDLVYHFNQLPPFSTHSFDIGQRVGIIGMGNVMVDVAHWLICEKKVEEVVVIARRGPNERAYTDKEMREIIEAMDQEALQAEFANIEGRLKAVGQDPDAIFEEMQAPRAKAVATDSPSKLRFRFLCTSKRIVCDDETARIKGLEVEQNDLVPKGDSLRPQGNGTTEIIDLDTLIYAIGDQVDASVGLPFEWGRYIVNPNPHPTVEGRARYEVYDPEKEANLEGWFVGGWARIASDGLVGKARADGETAVEEVLSFLQDKPAPSQESTSAGEQFRALLEERGVRYVTKDDVTQLEAAEQQAAADAGREFFKFDTNEDMLAALQSSEA